MHEIPLSKHIEVNCTPAAGQPWTLSSLTGALEQAATAHAKRLHIGHDRMVAEFHCLWMLVRGRLELSRMPARDEILHTHTWLRAPSPAASIRDYDIFSGGEKIGHAFHCWVAVHAAERKIVNLRSIPPLWTLPAATPVRTQSMRNLPLPERMHTALCRRIRPDEIDENGHMNNVAYVRLAEEAVPKNDCAGLETIFARECFAGELLTLELAEENASHFVRGRKENGDESFRMRFYHTI